MLRCTGPRMWALLSGLLLSGVAGSARAADDPEELDRLVNALNRDAASDPAMARGIRDKLGDATFLLDVPPQSRVKVAPGEALILHALCPTCTGWTSVVPGTSVTLQQLLEMHEKGRRGWGNLSQDLLGVPLGPLVRQVAGMQNDLRANARRGKGAAIWLIEEERPGGDGGGGGMGHRGRSGGGRGR